MASPDLIRQSAREYRAARGDRGMNHSDPVVQQAFAKSLRLNALSSGLFEVHRHTIAAEVALGCNDIELMRDCLAALVDDVRRLTRVYNEITKEAER